MRKVVLLITTLIVSVVILLSMQRQTSRIKPLKRESDEKGDAMGMIDYFAKIMNDPATGKFDLKAYYNAMQYANARVASRATNNLGLQWQFLGPDNIGGRTRAILFDKNNPSKIFSASVSGGLWISNDMGQSWIKWSGSDMLPNMNIVSLCQDANGNIYFGTGEGLYDNYGIFGGGFPGDGIWKSTDDGNSFVHLNSTLPTDTFDPESDWSEVNRIAANPHSPDSIIAATEGGLEVSGDGGNTWKRVNTIGHVAYDVKFSADGKKVYADLVGDFYYSTNGGASFINLSGARGFPSATGIERIEIAVSPTTSNYAYATLIKSSDESVAYVVQTQNAGNSWNIIGTGSGYDGGNNNGFDPTGDQGGYDVAMAVDPIDSNDLFVGGLTLWRWTPTLGWLQISNWAGEEFNNNLHADLHTLVFDPSNGSRLLIGCDGGICQTLNPYSTNSDVLFSSLNRNYDVTQFYSVGADSFGNVLGGAQDNGTEYINPSQSVTDNGISPISANIVIGGDGGIVHFALSSHAAFGEYVYATLQRVVSTSEISEDNFGGPFYDANTNAALAQVSAQFIAPYDVWENPDSIAAYRNNNSIPLQALFVVGFNSGEVWVTTQALNFETSPVWFRLQNVIGDVTATTFSADGNYLYVGTDAGLLFRYSGFNQMFAKNRWNYPEVDDSIQSNKWNPADSGISLTTSTYSDFSGRTILSIAIDPNNPSHIVATCGNYGTTYNTWIAQSNNSTDTSASGFTFSSIQGIGDNALPQAPIYSACIPHEGNGSDIIVGTSSGIWTSLDAGLSWAPDNDGLANVVVMSVKEFPHYNGYALYAGTHGRGMFTSYTLSTGINTVKTLSSVNNLTVFPNPVSANGNIQYNLNKDGRNIINLYDLEGQLIKQITDQNMTQGPVTIQFNVSDISDGTYIVDVINGNSNSTKKILVLH